MILPIEKDSRGKWMPNWKWSYVVTKSFSGGALILVEIDGDELQNPVNSDSVKRNTRITRRRGNRYETIYVASAEATPHHFEEAHGE
ncbi:hypothetical protein V6N12_011685 [Hibiscus sabdariffa]|uniref:Uncharacterized protein n=1 Tax=Hibiscus sabdariffa TaxID=183260 RepID=A0ABR2B608_9ROSI